MDKVVDYIISLTNLYGLVHKDKVVEIYNMQNKDRIEMDVVEGIIKKSSQELKSHYLEIDDGFFVSEAIMTYDDVPAVLKQRIGRPYYIPDQQELLKYKEDSYFEMTNEYGALVKYLAKEIFSDDQLTAEIVCENIQGICQFGFSTSNILDFFDQLDVEFANEQQVSELLELVTELANNTRLWENNGHTPNELFEKI